MARSEADLLDEINADLPEGVDWKQGAITYLRELIIDGGESQEWYHFVKPFLGGPDYSPFWVDVFQFLDVVQMARLAPGDLVIDVGCGPGWTIQWLAKLGHEVIGLDISVELLEIADKRMKTDPYPPYAGEPFRYDLRVHDIEAAPLILDRKANLALFESTLHHFFNPVAALRNTVADLANDGIVAVIEAAAPSKGTEWYEANHEIMIRYHTIERPYTRTQLLDIIELAGLTHVSFLRPVNGLFAQHIDGVTPMTWDLTRTDSSNIFVASASRAGIERLGLPARSVAEVRTGWTPLEGAQPVERRPDDSRFRWCGPRLLVRLDGPGPHVLRLSTLHLTPGQAQSVWVVADGQASAAATLTPELPHATVELTGAPGRLLELHSDRVFSPSWSGGADTRLLSFMVDESSPNDRSVRA